MTNTKMKNIVDLVKLVSDNSMKGKKIKNKYVSVYRSMKDMVYGNDHTNDFVTDYTILDHSKSDQPENKAKMKEFVDFLLNPSIKLLLDFNYNSIDYRLVDVFLIDRTNKKSYSLLDMSELKDFDMEFINILYKKYQKLIDQYKKVSKNISYLKIK